MGIGTEITLFFGGAGTMLGLAIAADRLKARRKRWRRLLAMEARMSSAWETAKIRMLWSAPGFLAARPRRSVSQNPANKKAAIIASAFQLSPMT